MFQKRDRGFVFEKNMEDFNTFAWNSQISSNTSSSILDFQIMTPALWPTCFLQTFSSNPCHLTTSTNVIRSMVSKTRLQASLTTRVRKFLCIIYISSTLPTSAPNLKKLHYLGNGNNPTQPEHVFNTRLPYQAGYAVRWIINCKVCIKIGRTWEGTPQGIVGCTPGPTYPYRKSLYKPYITWVFMGFLIRKNP